MNEAIGNILGASFAGVKVKIWLGLLALAAIAAVVVIRIADNRDRRMVDTAKDSGAAEAVIAGHETTFGQLKDANDAEEKIRTGGERNADRYAQCLQDSRRPAACERFRPSDQ